MKSITLLKGQSGKVLGALCNCFSHCSHEEENIMNTKLKSSFFSVFVMGSESNADQDAISAGNAKVKQDTKIYGIVSNPV